MLAVRNWRSPLVLVIASITLIGCAGGSPPPQPVSLAELATAQNAYDGSSVIAEGTVQTYDQPRHYWIEDSEQHRVELFPHELVEDLVGQRIRVTGRFSFRDNRGREIDIGDLEVLNAQASMSPSRAGRYTLTSDPHAQGEQGTARQHEPQPAIHQFIGMVHLQPARQSSARGAATDLQ